MTGQRWSGSFREVDNEFKNVTAEYIRRVFGTDMKIKMDLLPRPLTADLLRSNLAAYAQVGRSVGARAGHPVVCVRVLWD